MYSRFATVVVNVIIFGALKNNTFLLIRYRYRYRYTVPELSAFKCLYEVFINVGDYELL